nr:hypothetical protein [uncultured Kingella sp.]
MKKKIIFLFLLLSVAACGNEAKDEFVAGCMHGTGLPSGKAEKTCLCVYDELENEFGEEQMEKWVNPETPPNTEEFDRFMEVATKATLQCSIK